MREIALRIGAAWAVLTGRPVIRGVEFSYGEVWGRHRDDLYVSDASIESCVIVTRGPVAIRASRGSVVQGNEGDVALPVK